MTVCTDQWMGECVCVCVCARESQGAARRLVARARAHTHTHTQTHTHQGLGAVWTVYIAFQLFRASIFAARGLGAGDFFRRCSVRALRALKLVDPSVGSLGLARA